MAAERAETGALDVSTPEGELVKTILSALPHYNVFAWRNNTGAVKTDERFIRYGYRGSADILGITQDGRMICIECKVKTKLSSYQQAFLEEVKRRGGIAVVCRPGDWQDVIEQALGVTA